MTKSLHSITVRRLIQARRARVFDAFSRSEALAQWFTPRPDVSVEVLAFQFALAGGFRLRYANTSTESSGRVENDKANTGGA